MEATALPGPPPHSSHTPWEPLGTPSGLSKQLSPRRDAVGLPRIPLGRRGWGGLRAKVRKGLWLPAVGQGKAGQKL